MRSRKGSAHFQYAIIIALIALALIPVFYALGKNLVAIFQDQEASLGGMSGQASENIYLQQNTLPSLEAGSLSGTPENPQLNCNADECSVDFGTFSLSGIPANYNEVVETSGTSAGTDMLADLLDQIASQLALNNEPEKAQEIRELANIGHNVASVERVFEDLIKSCNYDEACIRSYDEQTFPKPADYDESFSPFPEGLTYYMMNHSTSLDDAYEYYINGSGDEKWFKDNLSGAFINQYTTVMKDDSIPDEIRGVVQELVFDINSTGTGFHRLYDDNFSSEGLQNYNASQVTDIDSAVICGAGWHEDTGTQCN